MNWKHAVLAIVVGIAVPALAKLPPPTPEEQKAVEAKKAAKKKQMEQAQAALERAQDRVVKHYKGSQRAGGGRTGEKTRYEDMPKTTQELPGSAGPQPKQPQSAEAHSGEVK